MAPAPALSLFAGAVALLPLASVVRRPTSLPQLVVESFAVTLAVIGLVIAQPYSKGLPCSHLAQVNERKYPSSVRLSRKRS
jgi:hypothetical protein